MTMYMYFHVNIFLVGIGIPLILNTKFKIDEIVAKYLGNVVLILKLIKI